MGPRRGSVSSALAAVVLFKTTRDARRHTVAEPEERVFRAVNKAPGSLHKPVWLVMQSGSLSAVFVVAGALLRARRPRAAITAAVAGTGVWAGVKLVKPLIGRGRPEHHLEEVTVRGKPQSGLGYPSGHAAVATTLALIATRDQKRALRCGLLAIAGLTGGARMYVGAHLPLDVAGGFAAGVLCGNAANAVVSHNAGRSCRPPMR